ncbi:MAG: TonB-dependent receptor, partial [Sphingorhabdus sp.]
MKITQKLFKTVMLSTISVASFGAGSVAYAQEAPQADDAVDEDVIIVTATKREQTLEEVPVAVSVTSAAEIERAQIRDLNDLQTLVPSLRVGQLQSSANTNFIIRGFGNGANNPGIEPSVGVFIDGVYRSRSAAQIGDLPNLQRVEVLRGPQSTLFGKNASAGVISIITAAPQYEFGGSTEVSYGNYNAIIAKADVTGPIGDSLAFSLAGGYNKRDGYGVNLEDGSRTNERNRYYARAQLLIEPSDTVKFRVIGDYDEIDENCCFVGNVFDGPTGNAVRALGGQVNSGGILTNREYYNFPSENKIKNYGLSLQSDFDLGALNLTSISAYRESHANTNADSDFTSADLIGQNRGDVDIETITQELRITSNFDGPLNFLLGGYYFDEKIRNQQALTFGADFRNYANLLSGGAYGGNEALLRFLIPTIPAGAFGSQGQGRFEDWGYKNKAYSLFGSLDFEIMNGLIVTGGFNYTKDKKNVSSNIVTTDTFSTVDLVLAGVRAGVPAALATNPTFNPFLGLRPLQFIPPFLNIPNAVESGKTDDSKWTYSVRLAWEATDNINLYASYGTGFKATSWNLSIDSRPFAADFIPGSPAQSPAPAASPIRSAGLAVNNLTTGTRYANPENATVKEIGIKAKWDRVAFNLTVFDQSIKGFQGNAFIGTGFVLTNAGKQSTFGIEFDGTVQPVDGLRLNADFTYLDPKYDSYVGSAYGDLSGRQPAGIPELSMTLGASYTHELANADQIVVSTDYHHEAQVALDDNPANLRYQREVNALNASITYKLDMGLQLTLWGRNLTDARYITTIFPSVAQSGSISGYPNQPRTYGAS